MESRIQAYLRVAASHQRDTERIGSFLATFSRFNDNPFLNYAIPDDNATPSPADVSALIVAYEKRSRKPRLEYITQLAPAVEEVLINAGFCVEGHLPLMICTPKSQPSLPVPPGMELILPVSDADLFATIAVQNEAYNAPPPDSRAIAKLRNSLKAGGIAVLARMKATGEPVGAGVCTLPSNQTTEIAGIGGTCCLPPTRCGRCAYDSISRRSLCCGHLNSFPDGCTRSRTTNLRSCRLFCSW